MIKLMKKPILEFEAVARVDKEYAFGSCAAFNGLFSINMNSGECSYLRMFSNEKMFEKRLHTKAIRYKNKVFFIPCAAEYISIYDMEKNSITEIKIKEADQKKYPWYSPKNKFNDAVLYKDKIFLIGSTYPGIVKLDLRTNLLEFHTQWIEGEFAFRKSPAVSADKFYIPSIRGNAVLCFDMEKEKAKLHRIGKNNNGSWGICKIQDELWLSPQQPGAIVSWNVDSGEIKEYMNYPKGFEPNGFACTKIYEANGKVGLLPAYANMALFVDRKTGEISENGGWKKRKGEVTYYLFDDGSETYIKNVNGSHIAYYRINTLKNQFTPFRFVFSDGLDDYKEECFKAEVYLRENTILKLTDFIERISMC